MIHVVIWKTKYEIDVREIQNIFSNVKSRGIKMDQLRVQQF